MGDVAERSELLLEPHQGSRVYLPHRFECHQLAALLVVRFVHHAHSAGPKRRTSVKRTVFSIARSVSASDCK